MKLNVPNLLMKVTAGIPMVIGFIGIVVFLRAHVGIITGESFAGFLSSGPSVIISIALFVAGMVFFIRGDSIFEAESVRSEGHYPYRTAIQYRTRFTRPGKEGAHNWPLLALRDTFGPNRDPSPVRVEIESLYNERGNGLIRTIWIEAVTDEQMIAASLVIRDLMAGHGIKTFEVIPLPVHRSAHERLNVEQGKPFGQIPSVIYRHGKAHASTSKLGS